MSWLSLKTEMWIDTYFEIFLFFGKSTFFRIILPTFLCFRMTNRNFTYCCQYFDERLKCSFSSSIEPIWWLKQSIKLCKLNESVVAITNTSCVYLLTCVWVFYFLKEPKFNLSPTLALYYTKATRCMVALVSKLSFLNLDFTYSV